jgi:hypothetical protein
MREAQKPDHVSLNSLLTRLKEGRYMVPDFQREFEWKARDIRDLTRSIFLDYYIGSLLLWKGTKENFASLSCEPLYAQKLGDSEHIVLDGQQRLTAINYAFVAPDIKLPTRANRALYFVRIDRFMAEEYDEAFDFWYVSPGKGKGIKGWNAIGWTVAKQFEQHVFPLSVVGAGGWDLPNWVQGYSSYWAKKSEESENEADREVASRHASNADKFGAHVKSITEAFQVSYIELDRDLAIDKVCDIFTQINSKGVRLDVFDLLNALLKPKGVQLKAMWREAEPRLDFVAGGKLNVYILQVMSLLRQSHCSPQYLYFLLPGVERKTRKADGSFERQIMVASADEFRERWSAAVTTLENAVERLRHPHEFGVSSAAYLPYYAILPVFAAGLSELKTQPPGNRLAAEGCFRLWYWASIFTNRYSASSETTAARDIQDLRAWFGDEAAEPPVVAEFARKVATLDLRGETKKGSANYNAIFNLAVIAGARDWISGAIPKPGELDDHHIVPKSWGAKHLGGNTIDMILNRTPLTDDTNRTVIADRLPNQYLPELIATNGRAKVEELMQSHFISPGALDILLRDPFTPDDFEFFTRERQRAIVAAIQSLLIGGRADLQPDLRALDEDVERIELALRALVATRLEDDLGQLPPHVRAKIDDRVARELRKNPGADPDYYASLGGALEFADLTELLGVMQSGHTAAHFSDTFPHKEGLISKFGQLGELRNGIRHSRTVSEIVRKEGEAAILWFDAALKGVA